MNLPRRHLLCGLATLALAGCSATKPSLYRLQAPDVDLRRYRTFAFFPAAPSQESPLVRRWLMEAARSELERRGYAYDPLLPELLVNVGATVEERHALRSAPGPYQGWNGLQTDDYLQGVLSVDLIDVRRRELVWQGAAKGRVGEAMLRDVAGAATKAMAEIFEGFPTQAGPALTAPQDGV
jgi:hypothetical protein